MTMITARRTDAASWARDGAGVLRGWLTRRRALWILGAGAVTTGLIFSWGWLAAIGVAPILVAALPCAAMCALGLCMNKMSGRSSCSQDAKSARPDTAALPEPPGPGRAMRAEPIAAKPTAPPGSPADAVAIQSERGERA